MREKDKAGKVKSAPKLKAVEQYIIGLDQYFLRKFSGDANSKNAQTYKHWVKGEAQKGKRMMVSRNRARKKLVKRKLLKAQREEGDERQKILKASKKRKGKAIDLTDALKKPASKGTEPPLSGAIEAKIKKYKNK